MTQGTTVKIDVTIGDVRHRFQVTDEPPKGPDAADVDERLEGRELKVIDFRLKGNVLRLFLGEPEARAWGDDWNDTPYEHNAGTVYEEYVTATLDVAFDFDAYVSEPCDGHLNSPWCKQDMQLHAVPCIATLLLNDGRRDDWRYDDNFQQIAEHRDATLVFFGDALTYGQKPEWLPPYAHVLAWKPSPRLSQAKEEA